jgi:antitoxin VapB
MSINIKNKEFERLLSELKARTGRGTTDLLLDLVRKEQARLDAERERRIQDGFEADERLRKNWYARPLVDPRSVDEILSFDEDGLPT